MADQVENFRELYSTTLIPKLTELDKTRKSILALIKKHILISLVPLCIFGYISVLYENPIPIGIMAVACIGFAFFKINPLWSSYYSAFKQQVIKQIIHFIDDTLTYSPSDCISQGRFEECGIFRTHIDRYKGDDLVTGKMGSTDMKFSEVHAEYKTTTTDSKGRRQTHWHTIFKGLLFSADFNKHFSVSTYVLTDRAEKLFGSFGTKFQKFSGHGDLVKLEDPEFEKYFVVYSSDQTEARYILSTSLMKRILDYKIKSKKNIQLSFVSSRLFVAVPYRKDLFEPKLFGEITDFESVEEYYNDLRLVLALIEDLNLNTRIWTKE